MESTPLINGINHAWSSITMNILGVDIKGFSKIAYKEDQDIEGQMGAGASPVSVGYGDIKYSGEVELYLDTIQQLVTLSPTGRIQDLPPSPLTITFLTNGKYIKHKLLNVIFTNNGVDAKAGDKAVKTNIKLFIGEIRWK